MILVEVVCICSIKVRDKYCEQVCKSCFLLMLYTVSYCQLYNNTGHIFTLDLYRSQHLLKRQVSTSKACNLRLHIQARFIDWVGIVLYFVFRAAIYLIYIYLLFNLFIFARDIAEMKLFINTNENILDFIDISKYIHWTCLLIQSHRLVSLLEYTDVNLRALGVPINRVNVSIWSSIDTV